MMTATETMPNAKQIQSNARIGMERSERQTVEQVLLLPCFFALVHGINYSNL